MFNTLRWYAWIPTNLGILNYDFITEKQIFSSFGKNIINSSDNNTKRFCNLTLNNFQDSLPSYLTNFIGKEIIPIGCITISDLLKNFVGNVRITYTNYFSIDFNYKLNVDGKISIFDPCFSYSNKIKYISEDILETLAQICYMIIKQTVHGDNHHHQKIDYILKVNRDIFPADKTICTFGKHIKNVERDVKSLNTCTGHLKAINAIEEIKGYISYAKTFAELNKSIISDSSKTLMTNMENVVTSLEATVTKKDNHFKYLDNAKTTLLSIFALIISLSLFGFKILMDNHDEKIPIGNLNTIFTFTWYDIVFYITFFGLFVFYWLRRCYINSYIFYNRYSWYESYKFLSWLSPKDSSFKHILLKLIIPSLITAISIYYILKQFNIISF